MIKLQLGQIESFEIIQLDEQLKIRNHRKYKAPKQHYEKRNNSVEQEK